jgi:hypothetical protein
MKTTKTGVKSPKLPYVKLLSDIRVAIVPPAKQEEFERASPGLWLRVGDTGFLVDFHSLYQANLSLSTTGYRTAVKSYAIARG